MRADVYMTIMKPIMFIQNCTEKVCWYLKRFCNENINKIFQKIVADNNV